MHTSRARRLKNHKRNDGENVLTSHSLVNLSTQVPHTTNEIETFGRVGPPQLTARPQYPRRFLYHDPHPVPNRLQ